MYRKEYSFYVFLKVYIKCLQNPGIFIHTFYPKVFTILPEVVLFRSTFLNQGTIP